jgi:glutamine amidotransferase
MCELLALNFKLPSQATFSFHGFRHRGKSNPDGWGFAYYDTNKELRLVKEHRPEADESELAGCVERCMRKGTVFVSHVRRISKGSVAYCDTHPFYRITVEPANKRYREWVMAHNGTLAGNYRKDLKIGKYRPIGRTDSEFVFCHILSEMSSKIFPDRAEFYRRLHNLMHEINAYGHFNFIMSNGDELFCYFDRDGYNGLSHVHREAPFPHMQLKDEDLKVNLADEKDSAQRGYVIATRPLTIGENWKSFTPGELKVFEAGEIVWTSK